MKGRIEVYFYQGGSENTIATSEKNIEVASGEDTEEIKTTALSSVSKSLAVASAVAVASVIAIQKVASSVQTFADIYADYTGDYVASNNLRNLNSALSVITNPIGSSLNAVRHLIDVRKSNLNAELLRSRTGNSTFDNSQGGQWWNYIWLEKEIK